MSDYKYNRVLLKISGEALMGGNGYGVDPSVTERLAREISEVAARGVQIAITVGGGNIFRGLAGATEGMDRSQADYMGMLATCLNALALQDAFERIGQPARVMSAIQMQEVCEPYIRRKAIRHMEKGRIAILAAGTGHPYCTTDTAAVQRALEIQTEAVMKATKVDGIYDKDPKKYPDAHRYDFLSFDEVIAKHLNVMDPTAFTLARDNNLPIIVFNLEQEGVFDAVLRGEHVGTVVTNKED